MQRLDDTERAELNRRMRLVKDGERASFEPLFAALWPRVRAWCERLVHHPTEAEDAAQAALCKLFAQASEFRDDGDVLTWALTIATWECRTVLRELGRRERRRAPEHAAEQTPEESVSEAELRSALSTLVGTLSAADREVLLLARGENLTGQSPATTRKRRERALSKLRAAWRKRYGNV